MTSTDAATDATPGAPDDPGTPGTPGTSGALGVAAGQVPGDGYVQSLARGLAVIRAFDEEHPEMTLSDVARRTDLSRAAARRFLLTLAALGYVRSDGRTFSLTPQVLRLGFAYLASQTLPDVAQPHLQDLSERIHESTSVAVLDGELTVKRLELTPAGVVLRAENAQHPDIVVPELSDLQVWGVATYCIHHLR